MSVALDEIATMSRTVVAEHGGLTVAAVTTTGGSSERVEVMIDITGCHVGACRFVVNITRVDGAAFRQEFEAKLREAIIKHRVE